MMQKAPLHKTMTGFDKAKLISAATLVFGCVATGFADYVTLLESDVDGAAAQGESSYMSSFLANPTEEGYGWSDGGDPDPNKDYLVSGKVLRTPCRASDSLSTMTFTFPGRSLRVTGGGSIVFRSSWGNNVSNYATVEIGDLTMCKGKLDNGSWARPTRWGGKITIDSSDYAYAKNSVSFSINMVTCYIPAKLVASGHESVLLVGATATAVSGSGVYRWVSDFENYRYRFEGDCTEYFATNSCTWGAQARVATSDFAGSFDLGNAGVMTVDGVSSATVGGSVFSRDGTIRVPASTSLDVRGGIDAAFADFDTHVSGGLNLYTRLPSSEPYVNTNYVTGGSSTQVPINAILLEANAELFTAKADLDGTLVKIPSGATFTVGDAVFKDVILDVSGGGRLALTNSFTATTPVKLRLSGMGHKTSIATLPVGNGELKAEDFTFENAPQFRYRASVETVEGIQTLWITDINPDVKDETTGYVVQKTADGSSGSYTIGSYNMAGNWSETDRAPHSGTNYYTAKYFRDKSASSKTFGGDSLTQADIFRLSRTTFEISDWRVLSNGKTAIDKRTGLTTAGATATFTFEGLLTVFATKESPFTLYGGVSALNGDGTVKARQTYVMNMEIRGDPDSAISADGAITRSPGAADGQVACEFPGDMSEYYGTLYVGTNETIRLGSWGLTNGTLVVRTAFSTITTTADAGAFVPVKRYISQAASSISVPAGTEFAITDSADITGTLTKSGDGLLTFGAAVVASEGATLNVAAGSFGVKSADAVNGIPVTFGEGARLAVDVEATGDLKEFGVRNVAIDAPFAAVGSGSVPVSFTGTLTDEEATIAVCTISSTATAPAFALPSKFSRRKVASSGWRTNGDGSKTFEVLFVKPGFVVRFR